MKRKISIMFVITCLVSAWTITSAQAFYVVTRTMMEEELVTETDLIKTADNFIVMFDTSSSTNEMVPGKNISKIKAAKMVLKENNEWLPDLGYKAGLYIYTDNKTLMGSFKEIVGMQDYNRARFATAIDQLPEKGQGPAMLQPGLSGLRKLLTGLSGKTVVFIFTDGNFSQTRGTKKPLQIAQELAKSHDVSFYLVSSATAKAEKGLLQAVSKVNASSRVVPLAAFMDYPSYISGALFTVKTTSYVRLKPTTQVIGFLTNDMLFDFDSPTIRSEYIEKLDMLGAFLQKNPSAYVVAAGFSDSIGDEEYNLGLSERRTSSVKRYLVKNFGIEMDRIVPQWFGELNPVGDNATTTGRKLNRRVEITVGGIN
jgi:OOP family OmpA-OmpF porin